MLHAFLGIDVAKETLQAALLLPGGGIREGSFENSEAGLARLLAWTGEAAPGTAVRCALEATGRLSRSACCRREGPRSPG